jgi:hypothetical protein
MKHSNILKVLSGLALFAFGLSPAALADNKGCSQFTVKGTYAFTGTGSFVTPVALAGLSAKWARRPSTDVAAQPTRLR